MANLAQAVQTAVAYTISQDFAAGYIVEQEKNLQGFLEDGRADQAAGRGNHALQYYQMQLMLLEQQNKKRLLMARQDQDEQDQEEQLEEQLEEEREAHAFVAQQMAAPRKRSRVDTQTEQLHSGSTTAPRTRKKQRKRAGGGVTDTQSPDQNLQHACRSSPTAVDQDTTDHDLSDLDRNRLRSSKDMEHEVMMTSQLRTYSQLTTDRSQLWHIVASSTESIVRKKLHFDIIQPLSSKMRHFQDTMKMIPV